MKRLALVVVIVLAACAGDDDDGFTQEHFAEQLVEANLLDEPTADCVSARVFEDIDVGVQRDIEQLDFEAGADIPPELEEALTNAVAACVAE